MNSPSVRIKSLAAFGLIAALVLAWLFCLSKGQSRDVLSSVSAQPGTCLQPEERPAVADTTVPKTRRKPESPLVTSLMLDVQGMGSGLGLSSRQAKQVGRILVTHIADLGEIEAKVSKVERLQDTILISTPKYPEQGKLLQEDLRRELRSLLGEQMEAQFWEQEKDFIGAHFSYFGLYDKQLQIKASEPQTFRVCMALTNLDPEQNGGIPDRLSVLTLTAEQFALYEWGFAAKYLKEIRP